VAEQWADSVPVLDRFSQAADPSCYRPLPDDWSVGVSDVVDSTNAIGAGRYKAVNLAGAGTICSVANALGGGLRLFVFGGDGASFAVPPEHRPAAAEALTRVAAWAKRDLNLHLRVGLVQVADIRAAGHDARVAFWQASNNVRYAMFAGGGMAWSEAQLKQGAIDLPTSLHATDEPDLKGLSCQWGPIVPAQGTILSLIVKPAAGATDPRFIEIASDVIDLLESTARLNPVPMSGPDVRWPSTANALQTRIAHQSRALWRRRVRVLASTVFIWLVFKLGIRVGGFEPKRYRREVAANTDFRKFGDALMMTVDCSAETAARLRTILATAEAEGVVRYGMHLQDEALMTCVVPSAFLSDHMHFVDGAGGGYARAAKQLRA
jgi:hypothetical protein